MRLNIFRASLLAGAMALTPAQLLAADISLDNVVLPTRPNAKITFKHIDLIGANLTQEEAQKLFSGATTIDEAAVALGKLTATRIVAPEAVLSSEEPGTATFHDLVAEGVDHGSAKHLSLGGFEASAPVDGAVGNVTIKSGALTVDDVQIPRLEAAIKAHDFNNSGMKAARIALSGLEITAPDKDTPAGAPGGNLVTLKLASARLDQAYEGDTPVKSNGVMNGIVMQMPKASQATAAMAVFGLEKIEASVQWSNVYDPAKQTFVLSDFTINAINIGSVTLRGEAGGIDRTAVGGDKEAKLKALQNADLHNVELRVVNAGAFERAMAFTALSQGRTPDAVKAQWTAIVGQGPLMLPGAPAVAQISDALAKFIANPKSVTIGAKPKAPPLKFGDLQQTKDPIELLSKLDVTAAADGPAPVSAPVPTAPAPAASAPATPTPAADAPKKLTGEAAWKVLLGNTVTGKDGEGKPLSEFYTTDGKVKQIDDDEVAEGEWLIKGEKICFEFPGDNGSTCYKLEVFGDAATFFDEDGDGKRYTILKGNAKGL